MKLHTKLIIAFTVLLLAAGIGGFAYLLNARMQANEYQFQVDAILASAQVANQGKALADRDKAVIAEYQGKRALVVPGNYIALSSYLRKDAVMPLFCRIDADKALQITFCGEAVLQAQPADDSGDRVFLLLTTRGHTYRMHIRGGNLWLSLVKCCMEGTYHDANLPLE